MKKALIIAGAVLCAGILAAGLILYAPSPTVDFRGEVIAIDTDGEYTVFTLKGIEPTGYTVAADARTTVRYCHKEDGSPRLSDIEIGDTLQGNYKKLSKKEGYTKRIEIEKH
jgi:hypothetical protein